MNKILRSRGRCLTVMAAPLLAAVLLSGCGSDEAETSEAAPPAASSDTATEAAPTEAPETDSGYPSCSEVWVAGAILPEGYQGCEDDSGELQAYLEFGDCTDGRKFTGHEPDGGQPYYAGLGGKIAAGNADDDAWFTALHECTGE